MYIKIKLIISKTFKIYQKKFIQLSGVKSMVTIYKDRCNGIDECPAEGVCLVVCALDAIIEIKGYPVINEDACTSCELCVRNCPNEALTI